MALSVQESVVSRRGALKESSPAWTEKRPKVVQKKRQKTAPKKGLDMVFPRTRLARLPGIFKVSLQIPLGVRLELHLIRPLPVGHQAVGAGHDDQGEDGGKQNAADDRHRHRLAQ